MTVLAVETSCDETSVAIVSAGVVRINLVASQIQLHAEYGGVVPELATRAHLRNLPILVRRALAAAEIAAGDLDAVAATRGPGLPSALLVGLKAAQGLAFALDRPFLGIHHHEAHLYSPWIAGQPPQAAFSAFEPNIALIVSGGHTLLVRVDSVTQHQVLGATIDDAAGECFDKTAKLLGLPYPGGPEIDRLAVGGDPAAFALPRPLLHAPNDDFSFSGLKTAVRYLVRDRPQAVAEPAGRRDLCASIQAAIVEVLVAKSLRAALRLGLPCVTAAGGVTCNRALRQALAEGCAQAGLRLQLAQPSLCTDNAAMIGILAEQRLLAGAPSTAWDADIEPAWTLAPPRSPAAQGA
ncbi:MAG: tRNA (adenosine(37)-N6)-threonylcarbamoyltransferase complex transferase subunit TsaD [Verrucomicrobia bacterium]|nr:tRNA (adenosine(37)-N6)-threonylcarbamoyltransferase complex transferase subunit TsaD [Verrucomicrobiota bacterium]